MWFCNYIKITLRGFGFTLKLRYVVEYQRSLPTYLRNRPKNIDHLLMRKGAVDHAMVRSGNLSTGLVILWKSFDLTGLKKKKYVVDFGNEQLYCVCSCICPDFKINRMIFKHFFAVMEGNHRRDINDISHLFRIVILF